MSCALRLLFFSAAIQLLHSGNITNLEVPLIGYQFVGTGLI